MRLDTGRQVEWCKERSGIISFLFTEEETGGVVFTTLKNKMEIRKASSSSRVTLVDENKFNASICLKIFLDVANVSAAAWVTNGIRQSVVKYETRVLSRVGRNDNITELGRQCVRKLSEICQ